MSFAKFIIWSEYDGQTEDDGRTFHARDAEIAVEKWAEDDDRRFAEYRIVGGDEMTVKVRLPNGEIESWTVSGRSEPVYSARRVS